MALTTLINGAGYTWSDVIVNILGVPVVGITKISYKKNRKMENFYGQGSMPVNRGFGNFEFEGKITLYFDEVEALKKLVASHDLQDIPEFDIQVSFASINVPVTQHSIRKCRFMNNGVEVSQGDMKVEVELDLIVGDIQF